MKNLFRRYMDDLLFVSGSILILVGAFMVHPGLVFVAVGMEMIALAVMIARRGSK